MGRVTPLPVSGAVLADVRGSGRALRVSWHADDAVFVLSLWRDDLCVGTFHLDAGDAPRLVQVVTEALAAQFATPPHARTVPG